MPITESLSKAYDPKHVETEISRFWEQGDYFHAEPDGRDGAEPYTIVIPPPNVTGALHLGHAINNTLQDILIRWHRMRGHNTLWMPGTDHAGIATQAVVERRLKEQENKNRHDVGRDALVERIWAWKDEYEARIIGQPKLMGCSCDWARTRFTLDDVCAKAVRHTFFRLFRDGLIYRGKRLVNWDPVLQTAVADDEVYHETVQGHLWHIRYPLTDGSGTLTVATTRPETMLGDTAVAVHPEDDRYKHLIGKTCTLPLMDREIPIIADPILVKREFGSGCVKVTPAHDPNDYACAERNGLDKINILTPDGRINENGGRFAGMDRYGARKEVVAALEAGGQLERIEDYETDIGHSDRSKTPIEPFLSEQWFVRMSDLRAEEAARIEGLRGAPGLAQLAINAVNAGRVEIHPERYAKSYVDWLGEKRDWCISRQLWWGHRIPIWYCTTCPDRQPIPGRGPDEDATVCPVCDGTSLEQDPDVLDTWFSSALWPHGTLGWPDTNDALAHYYPTSLLCTSRDIITLWVARMVLTGLYNTGEIPFGDVYIHTKILDGRGETMSKSKGNGVDPVDIIEAFGADALRFGMTSITTDTQDVRLPVEYRCPHCEHLTPQTRKNMSAETLACEGCKKEFATQWADAATADRLGRALCVSDKFEVGRNFCNKLFQAARFAFMNLDGAPSGPLDVASLPIEDRWILSQTSQIAATVNDALGRYQFSRTINALRDYFWGSLCDWYLELIKSRIRDDNRAAEARQVLAFCLDVTLRLFHPILPFITERLWRQLNELAPSRGIPGVADLPASEACVIAAFPPAQGWPGLVDAASDAVFADIAAATRGVREVRVTRGVSPKQSVDVTIKAPAQRGTSLEHEAHVVERLAGVGTLTIDPDARRPANAAKVLSGELQIYVHDVINDEEERSRLGKELEQVDRQIVGKEKKLANEGFTSRAPADVVQAERERLHDLVQKRATLTASVQELDR